MNEQPVLESERLILRPFALTDAARVQTLAGDKRIADMTAEMPHPYLDGMAEQWISTHAEVWSKKEAAIYAVMLKKTNQLIGSIAIKEMREQEGEVGFWIGVDYWNNGYCTEACKLIVDFGFHHLGLSRMHAERLTRNPASGRVLEKSGFSHMGSGKKTFGNRQNPESIERYELSNT